MSLFLLSERYFGAGEGYDGTFEDGTFPKAFIFSFA